MEEDLHDHVLHGERHGVALLTGACGAHSLVGDDQMFTHMCAHSLVEHSVRFLGFS